MNQEEQAIIETERLIMRSAMVDDAQLLLKLWTDPRVMTNVGFPSGLPITLKEIHDQIRGQDRQQPFGRYLIAEIKTRDVSIGECKMILPDNDGISRTDIKLLPEYWGHHYGVEIKQALVDFLFEQTDCLAVEGTPNVNNIASIKMQEAVGAVQIGTGTFHFPESKAEYTCPVHYHIYHVYRHNWEKFHK